MKEKLVERIQRNGNMIGVSLVGAAFCIGLVVSVSTSQQEYWDFDPNRITDLAAEDGITLTPPDYWESYSDDKSYPSFYVGLDLGSCSVHDVKVMYKVDENGNLLDLQSYSFSGHALAEQHEEPVYGAKGQSRYETVTTGTEVTFTFASGAELEGEILGSEPCQTLVSGSFIQTPR